MKIDRNRLLMNYFFSLIVLIVLSIFMLSLNRVILYELTERAIKEVRSLSSHSVSNELSKISLLIEKWPILMALPVIP